MCVSQKWVPNKCIYIPPPALGLLLNPPVKLGDHSSAIYKYLFSAYSAQGIASVP